MATARRGQQPALSCNITWCYGSPTGQARKDGKRVALPLQQSWTAAAVSASDISSNPLLDVHLYVRGGAWIEQFANKLVGQVGGNRHLSSIYVTGELRDQGEAEYKARLEAKGWTLPVGFQCDEWILYQRQGDKIIIKLAYARNPVFENVSVFLEAALNDRNIWWSLPVLVNTGNEPVFEKPVIPGIYSPAIEGQEIAVGISNRGADNVAVMPCIDGRNLLKSPYLLWAGDGKKRDWTTGGCSFVTFPGLQTAMHKTKRARVDMTFRTLQIQKTQEVEGYASVLDPDHGTLRVKIFRTRKIVLKSDPDRALDQMDQMWKAVCAAPAAKSIGPLRLRADSQELNNFDLHLASTTDEVKQVMSSVEMAYEAQAQLGEVVLMYRSLAWFREAAAAKHRACPSPLPSPSPPPPRPPVCTSPPSTSPSSPTSTAAALSHQKSVSSGSSPDSIVPTTLRDSTSFHGLRGLQGDSEPGQGMQADRGRQANRKSKSFDAALVGSPLDRPSQEPQVKPPETEAPDCTSVPSAPGDSPDLGSSPSTPKRREPSVYERLSQPKVVRPSELSTEPFLGTPRSASRSKERPPTGDNRRREREAEGSMTSPASRVRDRSPSPHPVRLRERSPAPPSQRTRDRSPTAAFTRVREKSPALPPIKTRDKSPAPQFSRSRDSSPAPPMTGRGRGEVEASETDRRTGRPRLTSGAKGEATKATKEKVVWIMPIIQGRVEPLQKDEIMLRSGVRNVANLRRQVKLDLAPLLDEWSTAELVVMAGDTILAPETLLDSLSEGTGSSSHPLIIEAPEKPERPSLPPTPKHVEDWSQHR